MIHIFRIYSKPSFGSLPNLFFRAKAGSLIVPVLIPSRRNALHSGGVGGGGGVLVARYANFQSFPPPFHRPSVPSPSPALPFPVLPSPRLASPHRINALYRFSQTRLRQSSYRVSIPLPTLVVTCILPVDTGSIPD